MFGAAWLTSVLAEREKLEGRPCRSFAPGARTIKLCSLDGRSWTNTGTLPRPTPPCPYLPDWSFAFRKSLLFWGGGCYARRRFA